MKPTISVIITTYNRPKFLQRSLDSVLNQTFRDFEIIIVDDCSISPINPKILEKDKNRITIKRLPWHTGFHMRPKNIGIMYARGAYIAYLDDDDVFLPNHLQVLYKAIVENKADVVYGDRVYKSTDPNEKRYMGKMSYDFDLAKLKKGNYIATSDIMHTIEAIDDVGFWSIFWKKKPDWFLMLKFGEAGKKIIHVPEILTEYWWHDNNYTSTYNMKGKPYACTH